MATLTITWTVATAQIATDIINDFAASQGYTGLVGAVPETKQEFIKRRVGEYVKNTVRDYRIKQAADSASTTAGTTADSNLVLT